MNHRRIAELCHVSTSTVSKALSGSREVSDEVAENIRQVAIETGYFAEKNKRKAANKRKKSAVIAIVCPEIISIYYSRIITMIKSFIEERGGRVAIYVYDFDFKKKTDIIEFLSLSNETDGIIVISSSISEEFVKLPVVSFDSNNHECNHDTVGVDICAVIDDIVDYLYGIGHRRIGFVGETNTLSKQQRFIEALVKRNLEVYPEYIYNIESRFEEIGSEAAKRIIASDDRPTAFVTAYDEIAVSLIYDLEKAGIRVPEDISVFGLNDIPLAPYVKSSLSTVRFFHDEQAALAVDILYDKIFGEYDGVQHLVVKHELVIRDSTAPVSQ